MNIENKVAVLTGGASGLGKASAELFLSKGARVVLLDTDMVQGEVVAKAMGEGALFQCADVTDEASVTAALDQAVATFGALHICCNFAGISHVGLTLSEQGPLALDEINRVIQVNLLGTFNTLRLAAERMATNPLNDEERDRGCIINCASIAAYEGLASQAVYASSKAGVVGMTLPVARDLADYAIRVNTIVPGMIRTPIYDMHDPEAVEALGQMIEYPRRLGEPDEVASLALHIVENGYINGECIRIDGAFRLNSGMR